LYRTAYARVSRSSITDTELQIGQFIAPKHGHLVTNHTDEALYPRSPQNVLPEEHVSSITLLPYFSFLIRSHEFQVLPQEYYWPGQRGHYYHVFNKVR
jgi:hypothetical protein